MTMFRLHRGSFEESMNTRTRVSNLEELLHYARKHSNFGPEMAFILPEEIEFESQGEDPRHGWGESFLVTAKGFVLGHTNADLTGQVAAHGWPSSSTGAHPVTHAVSQQITRTHGVKVLASRIVGSHLWGYADGVSDYDYHFVFVRPLNDYLGFLPHKTIRFETSIVSPDAVGHVDAFGYDITDFVHLMSKNDMNASHFMFAPPNADDAECMAELRAMFKRSQQPNLLIRKYIGHARSAIATVRKSNGPQRSEEWNAVRALVLAYQMAELGTLTTMNLFEASRLHTPDLNLELGPGRIPRYNHGEFDKLLAYFGNVDLSYPERTDEEVVEFDTLAKSIVRRFADTAWS